MINEYGRSLSVLNSAFNYLILLVLFLSFPVGMGMGLSVTLNPNGVGLQTALKAPLIGRDNLPPPPNILGGFVSAMGGMQGGAGMGAMLGSPGLGALGGIGGLTSLSGGGSCSGLEIPPPLSSSSVAPATSASATVAVVRSISGAVTCAEIMSSEATKVSPESDNNERTYDLKSLEPSEKSNYMLQSGYRSLAVSNGNVDTGNDIVSGRIQAVSVSNNGNVQGLSVKNCPGKNINSNTLASSVILGVGVVSNMSTIECERNNSAAGNNNTRAGNTSSNSGAGNSNSFHTSNSLSGCVSSITVRREGFSSAASGDDGCWAQATVVGEMVTQQPHHAHCNSSRAFTNPSTTALSPATDTTEKIGGQGLNQNPEVDSPCSDNSDGSLVPIIV